MIGYANLSDDDGRDGCDGMNLHDEEDEGEDKGGDVNDDSKCGRGGSSGKRKGGKRCKF